MQCEWKAWQQDSMRTAGLGVGDAERGSRQMEHSGDSLGKGV